MRACDIMTKEVVTVGPEASVRDIARLLLDYGIGAVPVVGENGRVLGMVGESDLMRRPEMGTAPPQSWWLRLLAGNEALAKEYVHQHGLKAEDVMSRFIYQTGPEAEVDEIVDLMERAGIRRVLVTKDGALHGVVSRSNIIRALLADRGDKDESLADDEIEKRLIGELRKHRWVTLPPEGVRVADGVVTYSGTIASGEERRALRVAAERTRGVKGVNDQTAIRSPAPGDSDGPSLLPFVLGN